MYYTQGAIRLRIINVYIGRCHNESSLETCKKINENHDRSQIPIINEPFVLARTTTHYREDKLGNPKILQ